MTRLGTHPMLRSELLVAAAAYLLSAGPAPAQEIHGEHRHTGPAPHVTDQRPGAATEDRHDEIRPPRTLLVGAGHTHESVASALATAIRGDTIRVAPGVYDGRILLDTRVTMLGSPGSVLRGDGTGAVVTMVADSSEVRGFRIDGSGRSLDTDDASIKMVGCRACLAVDNELSAVVHGVYILESPDVIVRGNRIEGDGALPVARRGNGIHVYNSTAPRVIGNRIRDTRDGIYFSFASGATVAENIVTGTRYGLHYMYSDDNRFERNEFRANTAGAALMFSKRIEFRGNSFTRHLGLQAYGLLLQTVEDVSASENLFAGNRVGLHLENVTAGVFRRNAITGNGVGVDLLASAENNVFAANEISANRLAVRQGSRQGARWSEHGRGNYWASPEVFDLDGDGVGDRPFVVGDPFSVLAARRPTLEPFIATPAARALSWAERSFPVFDIPRAVDPAPLVRSPLRSPRRVGTVLAADRTGPPRFALLALAAAGLLVVFVPLAWLHRTLGSPSSVRIFPRGSR